MDSVAIVLLAGGQASRFPGKLEHRIDGKPMVVRCYEALRESGWSVYVAAQGTFAPEIDARLDAPLLVDRRPGMGPLAAFLDACAAVRAQRVFAVAADQPNVDAELLRELAAAWQPGDEAAVPEHGGAIEPLAALYERGSALREGVTLHARGKSAMRDLIARLAVRFVPCGADRFRNVNRPEDLP